MIGVLLTLLSATFARKSLATGELANVHEFGILCRVYELAAASLPPVDSDVERRAERLLKDISDITLITTANDSQYDAERDKISNTISDSCKRIGDSRQTRALAGKMNLILAAAEFRSAQVTKLIKNETESRKIVEKALLKAIYGVDVKTAGEGENKINEDGSGVFGKVNKASLGSDGGKNCGGDGAAGGGKGDHVGVSLINDFFCLCIMAGSADDSLCHIELTAAGSKNTWTSLASPKTDWDKVKQRCPRSRVNLTVEAIDQALMAFHSTLGARVTYSASDTNKIGGYIFGKVGGTNTGCTGAASHVCVNYVHKLIPGSDGHTKGIPWETEMRRASWELKEQAKNQHQTRTLISQLEMLNQSAWETCAGAWDLLESREALAATEIGSVLNSSGKQGEKNLNPISDGKTLENSSGGGALPNLVRSVVLISLITA